MDTKKTLCRIGAQMKEAGLVTACDGNISFRRSDGAIVITPSGVPKGELKPKHLLVVDLDGHVLEGTGKASSESALHLEIYRKRDDVKAIIHAHPITATALTVAGIPFRPDIVTEGALVLGPVPTVPYAGIGSPGPGLCRSRRRGGCLPHGTSRRCHRRPRPEPGFLPLGNTGNRSQNVP